MDFYLSSQLNLGVFLLRVLFEYQSVPVCPAILLTLRYMFCLIGSFLLMVLALDGQSIIQSVYHRYIIENAPVPRLLREAPVRLSRTYFQCPIKIGWQIQSVLNFRLFVFAIV